jgi:uncharacterized Tic20 family protein
MQNEPQPVNQDERTQALLSWILQIFLGIVSPLIFYLIAGDTKPFVKANAAHGLAFQIVMLVLWIIVGILSVVTCGIGMVLYIVPGLAGLIVPIIAGIKANEGAVYEVPVTGKLARQWFKVP